MVCGRSGWGTSKESRFFPKMLSGNLARARRHDKDSLFRLLFFIQIPDFTIGCVAEIDRRKFT
jgi:hypothetical protein